MFMTASIHDKYKSITQYMKSNSNEKFIIFIHFKILSCQNTLNISYKYSEHTINFSTN